MTFHFDVQTNVSSFATPTVPFHRTILVLSITDLYKYFSDLLLKLGSFYRQAWDDLPGLGREVRFGRSVREKKVSDMFSVRLVIRKEIFLYFNKISLNQQLRWPWTPSPCALEEMLKEEGARVGLGGGYQPQPGGGQVGQELVCHAARPCGGDW